MKHKCSHYLFLIFYSLYLECSASSWSYEQVLCKIQTSSLISSLEKGFQNHQRAKIPALRMSSYIFLYNNTYQHLKLSWVIKILVTFIFPTPLNLKGLHPSVQNVSSLRAGSSPVLSTVCFRTVSVTYIFVDSVTD